MWFFRKECVVRRGLHFVPGTPWFPLLLCLLALPWGPAVSARAETSVTKPVELRLLNWSDYMDPELIKRFEKLHGVRIKQIYFDTEDLRNDMLLRTGGAGYDLVVCNDVTVRAYVKRGWLAPLAKDLLPNLRFIDRRWVEVSPEAEDFAVPYFWGTVGIAYRKDLVPKPVTSWNDLFRPAEELRGKILMVNEIADVFGMALKNLGYSANSTDQDEIDEAGRLLFAQRPYVRDYSYLSLDRSSVLVTGDVAMAMIYNGDAIALKNTEPAIEFLVPKEGGGLWVDFIAVLKSSPNQELAMAFINFLNEPDNATRLAEYVFYATPNKEAEKRLPVEFRNNPTIYPPKDVVAKSEFYANLPPAVVAARNRLYFRAISRKFSR